MGFMEIPREVAAENEVVPIELLDRAPSIVRAVQTGLSVALTSGFLAHFGAAFAAMNKSQQANVKTLHRKVVEQAPKITAPKDPTGPVFRRKDLLEGFAFSDHEHEPLHNIPPAPQPVAPKFTKEPLFKKPDFTQTKTVFASVAMVGMGAAVADYMLQKHNYNKIKQALAAESKGWAARMEAGAAKEGEITR